MTTKIRIGKTSDFSMPRSCVACGDPPGEGKTWTISKSKSTGSRNHRHTTSVRVSLPLCEACHAVSLEKPAARWISLGGSLLVLLLAWLGFTYLLPTLPAGSRMVGTLVGVAVLVGLFFLARWLSERVNQGGLNPEQLSRRERLRKSAAITAWKTGGLLDKETWIEIEFARPEFAAAFSGLNGGEIR